MPRHVPRPTTQTQSIQEALFYRSTAPPFAVSLSGYEPNCTAMDLRHNLTVQGNLRELLCNELDCRIFLFK